MQVFPTVRAKDFGLQNFMVVQYIKDGVITEPPQRISVEMEQNVRRADCDFVTVLNILIKETARDGDLRAPQTGLKI